MLMSGSRMISEPVLLIDWLTLSLSRVSMNLFCVFISKSTSSRQRESGGGGASTPPDVLFSIIPFSSSAWSSGMGLTASLLWLLDTLSSLYDDVPVLVLIRSVGSSGITVGVGMRFGTSLISSVSNTAECDESLGN